MRSKKWCDECNDFGHRKWLFLGTHRTHRLYLRWKMRKVVRRAKKERRKNELGK